MLRDEGVNEDDGPNRILHPLCDGGDDETSIGVAAQNDILQPLPLQDIDDVGDVGAEVHFGVDEVRPLTEACQRWREDLMPGVCQKIGNSTPAPATMPSAVNQDERLCSLDRHRTSPCVTPAYTERGPLVASGPFFLASTCGKLR